MRYIARISLIVLGWSAAIHAWNLDISAMPAWRWILGVVAVSFFTALGDQITESK